MNLLWCLYYLPSILSLASDTDFPTWTFTLPSSSRVVSLIVMTSLLPSTVVVIRLSLLTSLSFRYQVIVASLGILLTSHLKVALSPSVTVTSLSGLENSASFSVLEMKVSDYCSCNDFLFTYYLFGNCQNQYWNTT